MQRWGDGDNTGTRDSAVTATAGLTAVWVWKEEELFTALGQGGLRERGGGCAVLKAGLTVMDGDWARRYARQAAERAKVCGRGLCANTKPGTGGSFQRKDLTHMALRSPESFSFLQQSHGPSRTRK